MITAPEIMAKLEQYVNSPTGQRRVKDALDAVQRRGKQRAGGVGVASQTEMAELAKELAAIIRSKLPQSIAQVGDTLTASAPVKKADGSYEVILRFDPDAIKRESLDNSLGYDGIENIVALFNNGYHAKNYVYGWWKGHSSSGASGTHADGGDYAWVRSQKERDALHFMQAARDEFNALYGAKYNVTVQLGGDYGA